MMAHGVLLVDAQRDVVRSLRSALRDIKGADLNVLEAASGEEALLLASRSAVHLLVVDYSLPGMTGIELIRKIRAGHPEVSVIAIAGSAQPQARSEILNAGALAVFEKPIPVADFKLCVESTLGLTLGGPGSEAGAVSGGRHARVSDLLANFRQDNGALAVFLVNERGEVLARAGDLPGGSLEAPLWSVLARIHSAAIDISGFLHKTQLDAHVLIRSRDYDLLFAVVTPSHSILVAGHGLAGPGMFAESGRAMRALVDEVRKSLASIGVTGELTSGDGQPPRPETVEPRDDGTAPDIDRLLSAGGPSREKEQVDAYWAKAAATHGRKPTSSGALSYDEAKKMGLAPDQSHE